MNKFEELLIELGKQINTPLHPEKERLCKLSVNGILHVQLEYEENKDRLLIASFVADLPPGKFRENVCRESLKNNNTFPRFGTLAYSERNNKLVFFEYFPFTSLTGPKLSDLLTKFIETADLWRVAVETGQLGAVSQSSSSSAPPPFGIKR